MSDAQTQLPAERWPALMSDETAAAYLDVSPRLLWKLSATGELPAPVKMPGARSSRWKKAELDAYLAGLTAKGAK